MLAVDRRSERQGLRESRNCRKDRPGASVRLDSALRTDPRWTGVPWNLRAAFLRHPALSEPRTLVPGHPSGQYGGPRCERAWRAPVLRPATAPRFGKREKQADRGTGPYLARSVCRFRLDPDTTGAALRNPPDRGIRYRAPPDLALRLTAFPPTRGSWARRNWFDRCGGLRRTVWNSESISGWDNRALQTIAQGDEIRE